MSNLFNNPDNLVDVVRQILSGKPLEEKKKEEELDPVNKQAVKKKFDDRKDKDIDNDGDVDSTDKYLHKRRKAISKALNEKEPKKKINASHCEEVELDENISDDARELINYAENDGQLYRQSAVPIMKNLTKKYKKDIYDSNMAQRLWKYHADRAAKKYAKENGGTFSVSVRKEVAQQMERDWHSEMKSGNFMEGYEVELDENISDDARELINYAENDSQLYKQSAVPIMKNLTRKFKKDNYDTALAQKLWKYHADRAAKKYGKEHSVGDGLKMFPTSVRKEVAKQMESDWHDEMKSGNFMEGYQVELDEDASNFKSAVARIKKANTVKDLEKLEKTLERVYNQTNSLTAKEFGQLDSMILDKKVKLEEEVQLDEENLEENAAAIAKLKKAYEPLRGKKISPENSKRLNDIVKKFDNNKDMLMKIAKADIPFVSDSAITRLITKHNMKGAEIKAAMKEETFNEEKDDDGEEKTVAQKSDPDGDGKTDGNGKKKPVKKKKKKEEGDDEKDTAEIGSNKPDVIDTKPSIETSSMVSEAEGSVKVKSGPAHDKKVKSITGLAKKMGLKVTRKGKSDDGKMTTIHLSGDQKKILDMQALQSRLDEDKQELGKISKELEGASKMHKGQSDRIKAMLKKKDDTMKENRDDGETNLVVQLRKAISLRGNKVRFGDGKSVVISDKDAQKFMGMFSKLKKPSEKEMLMKSAAKSHKHFKMALAGKVENPKSSGLDLPKMKSEK